MLSDGISLLNFLFLGGKTPPSPGPIPSPCGFDTEPAGSSGNLGCDSYTHC